MPKIWDASDSSRQLLQRCDEQQPDDNKNKITVTILAEGRHFFARAANIWRNLACFDATAYRQSSCSPLLANYSW
jgi:hypothetical protein